MSEQLKMNNDFGKIESDEIHSDEITGDFDMSELMNQAAELAKIRDEAADKQESQAMIDDSILADRDLSAQAFAAKEIVEAREAVIKAAEEAAKINDVDNEMTIESAAEANSDTEEPHGRGVDDSDDSRTTEKVINDIEIEGIDAIEASEAQPDVSIIESGQVEIKDQPVGDAETQDSVAEAVESAEQPEEIVAETNTSESEPVAVRYGYEFKGNRTENDKNIDNRTKIGKFVLMLFRNSDIDTSMKAEKVVSSIETIVRDEKDFFLDRVRDARERHGERVKASDGQLAEKYGRLKQDKNSFGARWLVYIRRLSVAKKTAQAVAKR